MDDDKLNRTRKPHRNANLIGKLITLFVLTAVMLVGGYAARIFTQTKDAVAKTYVPVKTKSGKVEKPINTTFDGKKPLSILLLGTDTGAFGRSDRGRSDTIIVVTINPTAKRTTMLSIPRDTAAEMIDTGSVTGIDKINSAYAYGDSTAAIKTVENLLNIPIDYYVTVNMAGLVKIVDAVGGVDVNVPFTWTDANTGGQTFTKGPAHLDGAHALAYARMRDEDPEGDNGRQKRQQEVIMSIVKNALSAGSLSNYSNLMDSLSSSMRTNFTFDDLVAIVQNYRACAKTVQRKQLKAIGAYIGDAAFQVASTANLQAASDTIRTELGLSKTTLNNMITKENALNTQYGFDWNSGANPSYTLYNVGQ
ncbi:LCP family protein [Lacticaseibacillus yichunensis]|uniref:LCP family protein n=2 Tax=Bacilli TaxID=91061 RepID=A0ABW4CS03_9LACO|nr:LCP family protein [Lacticaseibacillus yichunensis]